MAKKINVNKTWSAIKSRKQKSFNRLKKRYQKLMAQLNKLQIETAKLKKSGVEYGSPSWKTQVTRGDGSRKEYLRILYPSGKRKYIGCKQDKIKEAMKAIERGEKVKILESRIRSIESEIESVISDIKAI